MFTVHNSPLNNNCLQRHLPNPFGSDVHKINTCGDAISGGVGQIPIQIRIRLERFHAGTIRLAGKLIAAEMPYQVSTQTVNIHLALGRQVGDFKEAFAIAIGISSAMVVGVWHDLHLIEQTILCRSGHDAVRKAISLGADVAPTDDKHLTLTNTRCRIKWHEIVCSVCHCQIIIT